MLKYFSSILLLYTWIVNNVLAVEEICTRSSLECYITNDTLPNLVSGNFFVGTADVPAGYTSVNGTLAASMGVSSVVARCRRYTLGLHNNFFLECNGKSDLSIPCSENFTNCGIIPLHSDTTPTESAPEDNHPKDKPIAKSSNDYLWAEIAFPILVLVVILLIILLRYLKKKIPDTEPSHEEDIQCAVLVEGTPTSDLPYAQIICMSSRLPPAIPVRSSHNLLSSNPPANSLAPSSTSGAAVTPVEPTAQDTATSGTTNLGAVAQMIQLESTNRSQEFNSAERMIDSSSRTGSPVQMSETTASTTGELSMPPSNSAESIQLTLQQTTR